MRRPKTGGRTAETAETRAGASDIGPEGTKAEHVPARMVRLRAINRTMAVLEGGSWIKVH
jgi:hypothetical protein